MFGKQDNSEQLFKDWKASETGFQNCVHTDEIICMRPTLPFLLQFCSPPVPSEYFTFCSCLYSTKFFVTWKKKKGRLKPNKNKNEREVREQFLIIELLTWKLQFFSCSLWKGRFLFWSEVRKFRQVWVQTSLTYLCFCYSPSYTCPSHWLVRQ